MDLEFIFSGLIALLVDGEIKNQAAPKKVQTRPVGVYLVDDNDHYPLMFIKDSDLDPGKYSGDGSCVDKTLNCAKQVLNEWEFVPCQSSGNDHRVWCLDGLDIHVPQQYRAVAEYWSGHRRSGGGTRHFADTKPNPSGNAKDDISWIPEMSKILGRQVVARKDFQNGISSAMEDIRGYIVAARIRTDPVWDWCDKSAKCTAPSARGYRKYDQVFGDQVSVTVHLDSAQINLVRRPGSTAQPHAISLRALSPVYVYNLPIDKVTTLDQKITDTEWWCIATHFRHYFDLLDPKPQFPRDPYFVSKTKCPSEIVHSTRWVVSTDPFCPPVIFGRP